MTTTAADQRKRKNFESLPEKLKSHQVSEFFFKNKKTTKSDY
jgi:hypothetical protein